MAIANGDNSGSYGAQSANSVVIGLQNLADPSGFEDAVIAGDNNSITASGGANAILSGLSQNISGTTGVSAILAGTGNQIDQGIYNAIIASSNSTNSGSLLCSIISALNSTISSAAARAVILSGQNHQITAPGAVIAGGSEGKADKTGQHVQANGKFSANGDAQTSTFVLRRQTTNGTQTEIFLDGSSARMTLANDTSWAFSILITARRTDADNESAAFKIEGGIDRQTNAASTALVAAITKTVLARDNAAWDVDAQADTTNGALVIKVTGEAAKTINWVARVTLVETTG